MSKLTTGTGDFDPDDNSFHMTMTNPENRDLREEIEALFNRAGLTVNYDDEEDPTAQLIYETVATINSRIIEALERMNAVMPDKRDEPAKKRGYYAGGNGPVKNSYQVYSEGWNAYRSRVTEALQEEKKRYGGRDE
tara:strand:+ start:120 stop:527 length:408 start_codon:yes stop_codon:yes gene_type:complete